MRRPVVDEQGNGCGSHDPSSVAGGRPCCGPAGAAAGDKATRRPRRLLAAAAAVVVVAGAGTWTAAASDDAPAVRHADRLMDMGDGVRIDTSYFTTAGSGRRPAVLLAHGFGGSKDDVRQQAEDLDWIADCFRGRQA